MLEILTAFLIAPTSISTQTPNYGPSSLNAFYPQPQNTKKETPRKITIEPKENLAILPKSYIISPKNGPQEDFGFSRKNDGYSPGTILFKSIFSRSRRNTYN